MTLTADRAARSTYRATGAAVVLGLLFGVAVWARPGGRVAELVVDDLGQLAAATVAAASAAWAAVRSTGSRRRAWAWIALGMGGRAAGGGGGGAAAAVLRPG